MVNITGYELCEDNRFAHIIFNPREFEKAIDYIYFTWIIDLNYELGSISNLHMHDNYKNKSKLDFRIIQLEHACFLTNIWVYRVSLVRLYNCT